ncbi:hypothetical protein JCM5353_000202 [Sporobolomyces roseus]
MATQASRLYCGIFVGVRKVSIAAEAHSRAKPLLDFFKLLQLRISNHSLFFKADAVNLSRVPQDVWEMVKVELIRDGLEAAELSLSNEAADFEMLENHVEDIRSLLSSFGLLLPSTQTFEIESHKSNLLLVPIAYPFPSDDPKTATHLLKAIDISVNTQPVPISIPTESSFPSLAASSDLRIPTQRDTSPSTLTQWSIENAIAETVPQEVTRRFKCLVHLYQLSPVNDSELGSNKQILLLKM